MNEFSLIKINHYVLEKNYLLNDSKSNDILQITEDIVGLYATGTIEPFLSLFVRIPNFNKEDLEK